MGTRNELGFVFFGFTVYQAALTKDAFHTQKDVFKTSEPR